MKRFHFPKDPSHDLRPHDGRAARWYRPMIARDRQEPHRSATSLELFFDLCFVVAVALAAEGLHHEIVEGHIRDGVINYVAVFFGIWWAWMNFTWFASAYDTDDALYRLATFMQMTGVLILAAGIPRIFANEYFGIATAGYVVMRLAQVPQWLRAAYTDPPRRSTALRYAIGISIAQIGWVLLALLDISNSAYLAGFLLMALVELSVPVWAESVEPTPWHHDHIGERYGLFTLIVLGETVLAITVAIQTALDAGHGELDIALLAGAGLITVFSMWWLYFDRPLTRATPTFLPLFVWAYGHIFIFGSIAAIGAGLTAGIDYETGAAHVSGQTVALSFAIPVAIYLVAVWVIRVVKHQTETIELLMPAGAVLAIVVALAGLPVHFVALVLATVTICRALYSALTHTHEPRAEGIA